MLRIKNNILRILCKVGVLCVIWAFFMAVIPVSCDYLPWRSADATFNNQLYRLVTNLGWIDISSSADNWDGNAIPVRIFKNSKVHLFSAETNGASISYRIGYNKPTGMFTRQPVSVYIGLIRTNAVSTLIVNGVSEEVSERLQRIFAARTNSMAHVEYPVGTTSKIIF